MRIGLVILPELRWSEAQRRWRKAEEYGFDHVWTYDQLGWRDLIDGPWFDAMTTLTAAAMVTSRIRLGTHVASANFRHPVVFARQVTALDDIADGRLLLGVGAGGPSFDAHVLGYPAMSPAARAARFAEFVELLDLLLRNERVTWRGDYYAAVDARSTPGCVQRPRAPLIVAADGRRSIELAARLGDGWVTSGSKTDDIDAWWSSVAESVLHFDNALRASGRKLSSVDRYLSLDAAPIYSLSSLSVFSEAIGKAAELSFTDVVTHWPRAEGWYAGDESILDNVAGDILPRLTSSRCEDI